MSHFTPRAVVLFLLMCGAALDGAIGNLHGAGLCLLSILILCIITQRRT